jgi:hypothetical protein
LSGIVWGAPWIAAKFKGLINILMVTLELVVVVLAIGGLLAKLPGYENGYGSARFLKTQDPDTERIRQVQKYIIIFLKFKKTYSKFRIKLKSIHESQH